MLASLPWPIPESIAVAIIAVGGVLAGHASTRSSARETARISLLDVTVSRLSERVTTLEHSLSEAETRLDRAEESERVALQRLWLLLEHTLALRRWGRSMAGDLIDPPAEPESPPVLDDLLK